jgi:hypothetical protein
VIVGKNVAVMTDYKTGPKASLLEFSLWYITEKSFKEIIAPEISVKGRPEWSSTTASDRFRRTNIYDSGLQSFRQISK